MAKDTPTPQHEPLTPRRGGLNIISGLGPISNFLEPPIDISMFPDWFTHTDFRVLIMLYNTRNPANLSKGLALSRTDIAHNLGLSQPSIYKRTKILSEKGLIDVITPPDSTASERNSPSQLLRISHLACLALDGRMTFADVAYRKQFPAEKIEEYSLEHIVRAEFEKVFSVAWVEAKDEFKKLTTKINKQNQEAYQKSRTKNREIAQKTINERITALENSFLTAHENLIDQLNKNRADGWKRGQSEMLEKIQTCMNEDREFYRKMHAEILAEIKDTIKKEVNLATARKD